MRVVLPKLGIDEQGSYTYAQLAERVNRAAGAFGNSVWNPNSVCSCACDTVDFPTVFWGAIKAGWFGAGQHTANRAGLRLFAG